MAPADDIDAAAAVHRQYPSELTDGTACCTSMTVDDIEAFLVRNGIRGSFDTIIGSDTPVEERGFVSVGHPVGTPEFVRAFCDNRAAADKIRHKLDCLRVLDGHPQVQLSLLRLCVVPTCVSVARAVHCDAYAQSIGTADSMLHDAVARLADIPSWDGHAASRARVAMPLKAGGLGVDVLANPPR